MRAGVSVFWPMPIGESPHSHLEWRHSRKADGTSEYLALPGGVLYFASNELKIATTTFVRSRNRDEITAALEKKIRVEEETIRDLKRSLHQLDEEILKRLSSMGRLAGT